MAPSGPLAIGAVGDNKLAGTEWRRHGDTINIGGQIRVVARQKSEEHWQAIGGKLAKVSILVIRQTGRCRGRFSVHGHPMPLIRSWHDRRPTQRRCHKSIKGTGSLAITAAPGRCHSQIALKPSLEAPAYHPLPRA